MVLEIADIRIQPGRNAEFEAAIQRGLSTVASRAHFSRSAWLFAAVSAVRALMRARSFASFAIRTSRSRVTAGIAIVVSARI